MNFIQNFYLFCLLICICCCVKGDNVTINSSCCPAEQLIRYSAKLCMDFKKNISGPLSLQCKTYIPFTHFNVTKDGKLNIGNGEDIYDKFCIGNISKMNGTQKLFSALLCADEDDQLLDDRVLAYCLVVSLLFLVPTALVYSALKELRDVQGKSIINFCTSLAIAQGILAILKTMEYTNMTACAIRGFLTYFFLLAAFFWTNAISIQVLLNMRRPTTIDYTWREFKWYFIYAWGMPTILTTCMAIVNFHPGDHQKPRIGLNHCWFFNKQQQWYYMYSVICILLTINIAIFIYVAVMICRLTFSSSHLKGLKYKLVMSSRLIVLMGLPWVFEMISSLAGEHVIWSIIDVLNCLQGVLIFLLLVVFRRRVIKLMYRHGWLNCISGAVERHLAYEDDEENVVQHTDVAMTVNGTTITQ